MTSAWQFLRGIFGRSSSGGQGLDVESIARVVRRATAPNTIYLGDYTALTRLRSGHKIYVDTRDAGIASHLMMDGQWEPWVESALIPALKPGMTFCDVGANFGYYTLLGAQAVGPSGKVYAFECNPRLHSLLRRSLMIDGFDQSVTLSAKAVSNVSGTVTLTYDEEFSGGGTTLEVRHQTPWTRKTVEAPCAPLDTLIPAAQSVHVMKIDVEGAEPLVIQGADRILSDRQLAHMVIEYYAPSVARTVEPVAFLEKLASYGFALQMLTERGPEAALPPTELAAAIGSRMVYLQATR